PVGLPKDGGKPPVPGDELQLADRRVHDHVGIGHRSGPRASLSRVSLNSFVLTDALSDGRIPPRSPRMPRMPRLPRPPRPPRPPHDASRPPRAGPPGSLSGGGTIPGPGSSGATHWRHD